MSIAKIVISGTVYRNPEKRFTGNNIPVTSLSLNIDENELSLIRVVARGNTAELLEKAVSKGTKIVVEGRLQVTSVQTDNGTEKKITEIDLSSFEVISSNGTSNIVSNNINQDKEVVKFSEMEMSDTLIDEDVIPF